MVTFGLLNEAFGRGSSSLTSYLTVQAMVAMALLKWGTRDQKAAWLPRLATGEIIASFAMTEPDTGSDLNSLATEFVKRSGGDTLILNGRKRWITCAQVAGVFLIFGKMENQSVACLVPRETPGFTVEPIRELMGFRAAGTREVELRERRGAGGQYRRQAGLRAIARHACRHAVRKNQHGVFGPRHHERLLRGERRVRRRKKNR